MWSGIHPNFQIGNFHYVIHFIMVIKKCSKLAVHIWKIIQKMNAQIVLESGDRISGV